MSQTHIKTLSLILIISVGCVQRVESQAKRAPSKSLCPDDRAWIGRYRNYVYGFSIVIPRGLKGYWNSTRCAPDEKDGCVCMGDHGRFIPLSTDASIEAFVGYQMDSEWSLLDHEHQAVSFLTEDKQRQQIHVVRSGWFRLGRLRARRFVARFLKDNKEMISDHIIALHKGVEYELILRTLPERYRKDRIQFEKVIASWRMAPRV